MRSAVQKVFKYVPATSWQWRNVILCLLLGRGARFAAHPSKPEQAPAATADLLRRTLLCLCCRSPAGEGHQAAGSVAVQPQWPLMNDWYACWPGQMQPAHTELRLHRGHAVQPATGVRLHDAPTCGPKVAKMMYIYIQLTLHSALYGTQQGHGGALLTQQRYILRRVQRAVFC